MSTADALLGRILGGRIELTARIGAGGMGRVYKGWHKTQQQVVAVKVINPGANQSDYAKRLAMELMAIRRVDHPNVVKVFESGTDAIDGFLYVAMEFVDGRDLGTLIEGGKALVVGRSCSLVREALAGLASAHEQNVLHRDIKPGNLMLTRRKSADGTWADHLKVVDFGLAKVGGATSLTETGFVAGTPGYMSPEQAMGEELDARTDIYACGVTLYRLLAGRMPFKGERLAAVLQAMQRDPLPIDGLDANLWRVVSKAIARDREDRFRSAREFAHALEPFVDATGVLVNEETLPPSADDVGAPAPKPADAFRLDAALGLAPEVNESAPIEDAPLTINQRPKREPVSPAVPVRSAAVASTPSFAGGDERPTPQWSWLALAIVLGALIGAFIDGRVRSANDALALDNMTRALAMGRTEEVEHALLQRLPDTRRDRNAELVARRVLEVRRSEAAYPFDPKFVLTPSTWTGPVNGHAVTFTVTSVEPWSFEGALTWNGNVRVSVRGVWEGNELLFTDVAIIEGKFPGYVFDELKLVFAAKTAKGVALLGYDGPKRVPMRLAYESGKVTTPSVEEREWPGPGWIEEAELVTYLRAWNETTRTQGIVVSRVDALMADGRDRDALATLDAELKERVRRTNRGIDPVKAAAIDAVISALYVVKMVDGAPRVVRRFSSVDLAVLREKHGPLVDRVVAHEALLLSEF
ncbi:MAG: serine/threonine protein kinase [Archangium sp.]|nr:serine/threonine protein kinase [Archangium sp.]